MSTLPHTEGSPNHVAAIIAAVVPRHRRVIPEPAHALEDPVLCLCNDVRLRHAVEEAAAVLEGVDVGRAWRMSWMERGFRCGCGCKQSGQNVEGTADDVMG